MLDTIAVFDKDNNFTEIKKLNQEEAIQVNELIEYMNMLEFVFYSTEPLKYNMNNFTKLYEELNLGIRNAALSKYLIVASVQNVLSSMRGYIDGFAHALSEFYGKESAVFKNFKIYKSKAFDNNKSYRFIEALRNYVQHRGFPIDKIRIDLNENKNSIKLVLMKTSLIDNGKLSPKNKDYINNNFEDEIDIVPHLNIMYGALLLIHDRILFSIYSDYKIKEFFNYSKYCSCINKCLLLAETQLHSTTKNLTMKYFNFEGIKFIADEIKDIFNKFYSGE